MVVILTDEQIEALKRGEMIKVESVVPVRSHEIFGIASKKWEDSLDYEDPTWSSPYRKNYREKYVKGEELYL